jgi:hypothetical protein
MPIRATVSRLDVRHAFVPKHYTCWYSTGVLSRYDSSEVPIATAFSQPVYRRFKAHLFQLKHHEGQWQCMANTPLLYVRASTYAEQAEFETLIKLTYCETFTTNVSKL